MEYSSIIFSGGYSTRMGMDKAQVIYSGHTQLQNLLNVFSVLRYPVFISTQVGRELGGVEPIYDNDKYGNIGPIKGLVSVLESRMNHCIIVAIDYPMIKSIHIEHLLKHHAEDSLATVYQNNEGYLEPFIGIYSTAFLEILLSEIENKNYSLNQILKKNQVNIVEWIYEDKLYSIDDPIVSQKFKSGEYL